MAAVSSTGQFQLHHSSPLDTLVRKTSARKPSARSTPDERQPALALPQLTTGRQPWQVHHPAAPSSPLLHSHFKNRDSNATWDTNDNSSYLDPYDSNVPELDYGVYDAPSPTQLSSAPALRDSWQSSTGSDQYTIRNQEQRQWDAMIPTLTLSEPVAEQMGYTTAQPGRTPIIQPTTTNFSRPARPLVEVPDAWEDEQKQRVLQRNGRRTAPSTPDHHAPSAYFDRPAGSPLRTQLTPRPTSAASSVYSVASSPRDAHQPVTLSRRPPSLRPDSPVSLYSAYSFYQLDSASPSPTDKAFAPPSPGAGKRVAFAPSRSPSTTRSSPQTAQEYLQLGIQHHEADRLSESAVCFERAATIDGGCGVGMLMWGLALRHGWGCTKNEKLGFKWLRRAAESAVSDLESARKGGEIDNGAVQTELVLAIYEVGQCFFHGWGIAKDQKMGVSYYAVAARMGDADAQMDLAFCLANGKGSKKDRKEAAKWYRAAVAQGQSDIGLGWIYKDKYR